VYNEPVKYPSRRRKNLLFLIASIIAAIILSRQQFFHEGLLSLGGFGYLGAFFGGILFSSSFTVSFSLIILATLAEELSPVFLSIIAGFGAMMGDFFLLRFFKDEISKDLEPIYEQLGGGHLRRLLHTKYFSWTLPILGAVIIASPLPDELGITLLGVSRLPPEKFLVISYCLNTLGILIVATMGAVL
jgi:hypothetical protein